MQAQSPYKDNQEEVQKTTRSSNLNLFIYNQIKAGLRPSKICEKFNIKKSTLQYHLSIIKRSGFVKRIGYGVWEICKEFNPQEVQKSTKVTYQQLRKYSNFFKPDKVRAHAFQFKLKLPKLRNWENREEVFLKKNIKFKPLKFGGIVRGQSINFRGRKIWLTNKSIIIYEKSSYLSDTAEESKNKFRLDEIYKQEEENANEITRKIKQIILQNNSLRDLLDNYKDSYKDSYRLNIDVNPKKISSVYGEINKELGIVLKKTLSQAVDFKNKLIESRKNFIKSKIEETEETLIKNSNEITKLDLERSKIFDFLENKKAIKDLTELFNFISDKKEVYDDLKGKISLIEDMNESYLAKKTQYAKLQEDMNEFIKTIKTKISSLREIYNEIYDSLYSNKDKEGFFDIKFDKNKKSKIYIIASSQDADGYGKNKGCILVYDLTLLFNIARNKDAYPGFWIHDGVFNGIYKNQFVSAMNLLNKKSAELDFQYIITLNEDEEITDKKFGELDFDIKDHVVAKYTNETKGKIFKKEF